MFKINIWKQSEYLLNKTLEIYKVVRPFVQENKTLEI